VYTAIHLNVPPAGESGFAYYARKSKWVVIALVAPEMVLFSAWFQWYQARAVQEKLNQLRDEKQNSGKALEHGLTQGTVEKDPESEIRPVDPRGKVVRFDLGTHMLPE
jgi:hypothetical protein